MSISTPTKTLKPAYDLSPIDSHLKQFLFDKAEQHNAEYKPALFRHLPDLHDIGEVCTFGVYAQTLMQSRRHFMTYAGSVNIAGAICSITQVSRWYLDYYHPKPLRSFGALTRATYELPPLVPTFIKPSILIKGTYVDISNTYFSILLNTGWDVSFYSGVWLTPGRMPLDFPLQNCKPARSYLVTQGLKGVVGIWTGAKVIYKPIHNRHLNYELWGYIKCVLHSIARFAVEVCNAIYVHTDGYIVPSNCVQTLMSYISSFHLSPRIVSEGETFVCGFGNYKCGDKYTKIFRPDRHGAYIDKINRDINPDWIRNETIRSIRTGVSRRLYDTSVR